MAGFFICGVSSLPHEDEGKHAAPAGPKHKRKLSRNMEDKNPYAARGLKQFCALLAEVEEKRQKIYSEVGAEAISLIRFVYSNDNKCKPIIVIKAKQGKEEEDKEQRRMIKSGHVVVSSLDVVKKNPDRRTGDEEKQCLRRSLIKLEKLMRVQPSHGLLVIIVTVALLLFVALCGRSAATFCASIGWYLVPSLTQNGKSSLRRLPEKEKKEKLKLGQKFSSFNCA